MREFIKNNYYVSSVLLFTACAFCLACSGTIVSDEYCYERIGVVREGIHYGKEKPSSLNLDPGQSDAIAALVVHELVNEQLCSAVMVAEEWFLTADHCYQMIDSTEEVYLFFGDDVAQPDAIREIVETIEHPTSDLRLLSVGSTVRVKTTAAPIALNQEPIKEDHICRNVTASGYGVTESGDRGKRLFVSEHIVDFDEEYISINGFGRRGACIGDSGGPLLIRNEKNEVKLIGVLQTGQSNCVGIDMFIRVDVYSNWIIENTN